MIIPGLHTPPADTEKAVTDDYVKAVNLNYHIKAAAQVAQQSLYEMCKGFKEMRAASSIKSWGITLLRITVSRKQASNADRFIHI